MKFSLLPLAAALLLFASSCQKDQSTDPSAPTNDVKMMRQYLIDTYGFKPQDMAETPEAFIAEGDMMFAKANFWEEQNANTAKEFFLSETFNEDEAGERRQRRAAYLVSYNYWNIKVNIKSDVPQVWRTAILAAIDEWNDTGGYFYFEPVYQNYSMLNAINIEMGINMDATTIASTYLPTSNAKPGSSMHINPSFNGLNSSKKLFAMVHEIGHAVGFRHTDTNEGYPISAASYSCANNPDPGSVMQKYVGYWYGFTSCDLDAYYVLYPW